MGDRLLGIVSTSVLSARVTQYLRDLYEEPRPLWPSAPAIVRDINEVLLESAQHHQQMELGKLSPLQSAAWSTRLRELATASAERDRRDHELAVQPMFEEWE